MSGALPVPGGRLAATVSARPVCPSPCLVSGCPRDTGSKSAPLHPCGCGSRFTCFCSQSFSPHLCSLSLSLCCLLCLSLPTPGASPMDISGTTLPNPTSDPLLWPQSPAQSHMPGTRGGQETGVGLGQGGWGLHCGGCRRQRAAGPFPVTLRVGWGRPLQRFACRQWPPPPRGLPGGAFLSPPWNVWRDGLGSPGDRRAQDGSELSKPRRPPNLLLLSSRTCFVHFRNPGPPEVCLEVGSAAPPARPLGLLGKALGLWSRGAAQGQR